MMMLLLMMMLVILISETCSEQVFVGDNNVPLQNLISRGADPNDGTSSSMGRTSRPCDNFYAHICSATNVDESHFLTLDQHHHDQIDAWLHEMPFYHDCMDTTQNSNKTIFPNKEDDIHVTITSAHTNIAMNAADLIRSGWTHPLKVAVVPSLAGPAYVIDLGIDPSLYMWWYTLLPDENRHNTMTTTMPDWSARIYTSHAFRHWMTSMFTNEKEEEEQEGDQNHTLEEKEDRQAALSGLASYVRQYEPYEEIRGHLSKRAAGVLDRVLGYTRQEKSKPIWVHRNGMPYAVLEAILLTSIEHVTSMQHDLGRLTLELLETAPPRGYLYHAAWLEDAMPAALRAHFRLRTMTERLRHASVFDSPNNRKAQKHNGEEGEEEEEQEEKKKQNDRSILCTRLTRAVHMAPLNRLFFEDNIAGGMKKRRDAAEVLVRAIRARLRRIVDDTQWLHVRTREAALEKLDRLAIYVLEPPLNETAEEHDSAPHRTLHYEAGIRAWLARRADAQWRLLEANREIHSLADYDRMARESLAEQWFHEVNYEIVNAWYDPTRNTITIPPGILFAPIYRGENDVADIASMGTVIGHEMGHSLDVSGRFFDAHGFYVMPEGDQEEKSVGWWRDHDVNGFDAHMACLAAEFGHPCARDDYGMHTMGEEYDIFLSQHDNAPPKLLTF